MPGRLIVRQYRSKADCPIQDRIAAVFQHHAMLLERQRDAIVLLARILLVLLFVTFGWEKLVGFSATVT